MPEQVSPIAVVKPLFGFTPCARISLQPDLQTVCKNLVGGLIRDFLIRKDYSSFRIVSHGWPSWLMKFKVPVPQRSSWRTKFTSSSFTPAQIARRAVSAIKKFNVFITPLQNLHHSRLVFAGVIACYRTTGNDASSPPQLCRCWRRRVA